MQEVTIRLRFTSPCLGCAKRSLNDGRGNVIFSMPRDARGRVIFITSWWRERMEYAAKVAGMCYDSVAKIEWSHAIDGCPAVWRRMVTTKVGQRPKYALHEAFRPGMVIGLTAVLPDGISLDDFTELLSVVGEYKGISPFRHGEETFGKFDVVSVLPAIRQPRQQARKGTEHDASVGSSIRHDD